MNNKNVIPVKQVKKQHIEAAATFAAQNVPGTDEDTLQKFLELVNITGNFGTITEGELLEKMQLIRKYIPGACAYSLFILVELLEIGHAQTGDYQAARPAFKSEVVFSAQFGRPEVANPVAR